MGGRFKALFHGARGAPGFLDQGYTLMYLWLGAGTMFCQLRIPPSYTIRAATLSFYTDYTFVFVSTLQFSLSINCSFQFIVIHVGLRT